METLQKFWKWLTHVDAKALFIVSLLAFVTVTAWRGFVEFRAMRSLTKPQDTDEQAAPAEQPSDQPLGILALVSNELAHAVPVPVNPFRPTAENIASNLTIAIDSGKWPPRDRTGNTGDNTGRSDVGEHAPDQRTGRNGERGERGEHGRDGRRRPERLTYRGMIKRPDGTVVVGIEHSQTHTVTFCEIGAEHAGTKVLDADIHHLTLRTPDGREHRIAYGDAVRLPRTGEPPRETQP